MIKQLAVLACLLICVQAGHSQRLAGGISGSMDFFSAKGDGLRPGFKAGYNAGIFAQWKITHKWKIRPEVLFTQKNLEASPDFKQAFPQVSLSSFESEILLNAIAVPLLVSYSVSPNWSVVLGPQYMHIIDGDEKLLREGKTAFSNHEWSMAGGVQWQLTDALSMQGRYTYGLSNMNTISDSRPWKSRSFSLGVNWRLF